MTYFMYDRRILKAVKPSLGPRLAPVSGAVVQRINIGLTVTAQQAPDLKKAYIYLLDDTLDVKRSQSSRVSASGHPAFDVSRNT